METRTESNGNGKKQGIPGKKIIIKRTLDLPLNKTWRAWTQPESFKKWWGPQGFTCPSSSMDFRIGGKYLHCMRSPKGEEVWSTGIFKEIDPYKKLTFTDSFSDDKGNVIPASDLNMPGEWPRELMVTVDFKDEEEKTRLQLEQDGVPSEMYDNCITGWNESFDKLEENID